MMLLLLANIAEARRSLGLGRFSLFDKMSGLPKEKKQNNRPGCKTRRFFRLCPSTVS